jgi:hypothetical protein
MHHTLRIRLSMFGHKSNMVFRHQYIDWDDCIALSGEPFIQALTMLAPKGCKTIMCFKYD